MKLKSIFLSLTLLLTFSVNSFASNELSTLKLIGRGIENHKTKEVIAMACVDENCHKVQAVLFNAERTQFSFFGSPMTLSERDTPTKKEIKHFFNQLDHKKRELRMKNMNPVAQKLVGWTIFGATGGVLFKGIQLAVMSGTLGLATSILIPVAAVGACYLVVGIVKVSQRNGGSSNVFIDQNGWNWSVRPKQVSNKSFKIYIDALSQPTSVETENRLN